MAQEQDITLVLMHPGEYPLSGGGTANFVVGMKDCLDEAGGAMTTGTGWNDSDRRAWCNSEFLNAIPETLRNIFKLMQTVTGASVTDTSTPLASDDYFALANAKEVYGSTSSRVSADAGSITFEYYTTPANRAKKQGPSSDCYWHTRTMYYNESLPKGTFAVQASSKGMSATNASASYGISPFGCI